MPGVRLLVTGQWVTSTIVIGVIAKTGSAVAVALSGTAGRTPQLARPAGR